jgi:hypothetical protein
MIPWLSAWDLSETIKINLNASVSFQCDGSIGGCSTFWSTLNGRNLELEAFVPQPTFTIPYLGTMWPLQLATNNAIMPNRDYVRSRIAF